MFNAFLDINTLSFPGLGIGEFKVNEIAFTIFGRDIAWYGIIVTLAIVAVCSFVYFRAQKLGFKVDDILDYFIFSILFGIIGARLYYVIFDIDKTYIVSDGGFWENVGASLYNIVAVWNGGIAIYGGVLAIILTILIISKIKKLPFLKMLDAAGSASMLGQAIGRWGNFVNAEAHGGETDIFCRMGITNSIGTVTYYHPTFLYESLWNLLGFSVIMCFLKKQKYDGQAFLWYVTWYGFGRMFIEGLRTDSLYIGSTGIRVSQLLAFLAFVGGLTLLAVLGQRHAKRTLPENAAEADAALIEAGAESFNAEAADVTSTKENSDEVKSGDAEKNDPDIKINNENDPVEIKNGGDEDGGKDN